MSIQVMMFGKLADITGSSVSVSNITDTDTLINTLQNMYPLLAETKYIIAVNREVIKGNTILDNNSVVALLPPFSGG